MLKGRDPTLHRWPGERVIQHRAMLLFMMQAPGIRSNRAVSRAMGRRKFLEGEKRTGTSEANIRKWREVGCWDERAAPYGDDADQFALDLYRSEYMADYGPSELVLIAPNIVRPIGSMELNTPEARASHEARIRVSKALPLATEEVEKATARAITDHKVSIRKDAERHIKLLDASLGVIAKRLRADEIRVSIRDIPILLDCRDKLIGIVSGTQRTQNGAIVESARVQYAKQTGGDLVAAMREDAVDMLAILDAMASAADVDRGQIARDDQTLRDETAAKQA